MASSNYTEPKTKISGSKSYVWFYFWNKATGKKKHVIRKGGANYPGLTNEKRLATLQALQKALLFKLKEQQWDPITNSYPTIVADDLNLEKLQQMDLFQALDYAFRLGHKKWSKKTTQD